MHQEGGEVDGATGTDTVDVQVEVLDVSRGVDGAADIFGPQVANLVEAEVQGDEGGAPGETLFEDAHVTVGRT